MRSYFLPFLAALGIHLLLLCSFHAAIERPEYGVAKGLSSLEVHLNAAPQEKKAAAFSEIKKATRGEKMMPSKKEKSVAQSSLQKMSGSSHDAENFSSASSGAVDVIPSYLHNPQPLYPEQERQCGHEGTVLLRVTIDEQGAISTLHIDHSSGYPLLDQQAANTVKKSWLFRPAQRNHQAVVSTALVPIHFSLKE